MVNKLKHILRRIICFTFGHDIYNTEIERFYPECQRCGAKIDYEFQISRSIAGVDNYNFAI